MAEKFLPYGRRVAWWRSEALTLLGFVVLGTVLSVPLVPVLLRGWSEMLLLDIWPALMLVTLLFVFLSGVALILAALLLLPGWLLEGGRLLSMRRVMERTVR